MAGAVCTMTCFWGSSRTAQTESTAVFSVMAPTGQTAAHWPHCTQTTSLRLLAKAGPMTVVNPRFWAKRAPTPCTSLQAVTQRRQPTHLPVSRTRAGVESSITDLVRSPRQVISTTCRSRASLRNSQSPLRTQA